MSGDVKDLRRAAALFFIAGALSMFVLIDCIMLMQRVLS